MSTEGLSPVLVDQYGGLCTLIDRSDLPVGLSPSCQNVEFFPGGVRSRSGFAKLLDTATAVRQMYSYVDARGDRRVILLLTDGSLEAIIPGGTTAALSFYSTGLAPAITGLGADLFMRGATAQGRAYLTFSDGVVGTIGPFQYDGNKVSAVSQSGPAADFTVTPAAGGVMSAGRHDFVVVYETSTGYVTAPSAPVGSAAFTNPGNSTAALAALPLGPGTVTKRIIFATPAGSTSFFTLPRFVVNDNSTVAANLTFTDSELLSGTSLDDFIDNVKLPPMLGVCKYGSRLVYWGGQLPLQAFFDSDAATGAPVSVGYRSLDFDGNTAGIPAPWVATVAGGSIVTELFGAPLLVYKILGDGVTAGRGQIDQVQANVAASGTYYVLPKRRYGIRARVKISATSAATDISIVARYSATNVVGSGTAFATLTQAVSGFALNTWTVLGGGQTVSVDTGTSGAYVNMTVKTSGTLANAVAVYIDWIEIYDLDETDAPSVLYVTPPDDPETVRAGTDIVSVAAGDGQTIRNAFQLRGNLYALKERSLYATTDDGAEPYAWAVDQVSNEVGTPSVHGVVLGDGWAAIASRNGAHYFTGGVPEKISQEIQPLWDSIYWNLGHAIWSAIDTAAKRIYFGVNYANPPGATPGGEVVPKTILVLDYVEGFGDPIAGGGSGRKWTEWRIGSLAPALPHGIMAERDDLTADFIVPITTEILIYDPTAVQDGALATGGIGAIYETAPAGSELGRSLFDRLVMRIRGSGSLATSYRKPGGTLVTLPTKTLATAPDDDVEIKLRAQETQIGFRISTGAVTSYWSLRRLGVFLRPSEFSYLRKT